MMKARQIMTLACLKSDADVAEIRACRDAQLEVFQRCLLPQEGTHLHWPTQMLLPVLVYNSFDLLRVQSLEGIVHWLAHVQG